MITLGGSASWGWVWWVVGGVVLLAALSGMKGGSARYIHVPDGESWRAVYRKKVVDREKSAPAPASRLVFGIGMGLIVVAVLLVYYKPF